jgi:hypothetical protein
LAHGSLCGFLLGDVGTEDEHQIGLRVATMREHVVAVSETGFEVDRLPGGQDVIPALGAAGVDLLPAVPDDGIAEDGLSGPVGEKHIAVGVEAQHRSRVHVRETSDLGDLTLRLLQVGDIRAEREHEVALIRGHVGNGVADVTYIGLVTYHPR